MPDDKRQKYSIPTHGYDYLNQVQYNNGIPISLDKIFEMKSGGFKVMVLLRYWHKKETKLV